MRMLRYFSKPAGRHHHDFQHEIWALTLVALAIYLTMVLISYEPTDESLLAASFPATPTNNLGGFVGAQIAALCFYFLGIASFYLLAPLYVTSFLMIRGKLLLTNKYYITGWLLGLLALSGLISLNNPVINWHQTSLLSTGILGQFMANIMSQQLGYWGAILFLLTFLAVAIILIYQKNIVYQGLHLLAQKLQCLWSHAAKNKMPGEQLSSCLKSSYNQEDSQVTEASNTTNLVAKKSSLALLKPQERSSYPVPNGSIFRTQENQAQPELLCPDELEHTAQLLKQTFSEFCIEGEVVAIQPGPVVTVFEFAAKKGIKLAKILSLADDLALALKVDSIIMHPVRGKRAIGIQVPNKQRQVVYFGDLIHSSAFNRFNSPLTLALGKSLAGEPVCADLRQMPHLLIAGATGSGKSVAINALLCSIIMKATPAEVRLLLVDPKMLELSIYNGIPHLLMPVITDPHNATLALKWAIKEMEQRYELMQFARVRNIQSFNEFIDQASPQQKKELSESLSYELSEINKLPYLVIVIDELADLMLTASKEVESHIQRLAQKARASGIHMILATQRPSVDVITGVIKANLPCRAAFQVVSKHDSRTILDQIGAEKLLGHGDMLIQRPGLQHLERIQGAFVSDEEVNAFVESLKRSNHEQYDENIIHWIENEASKTQSLEDINLSHVSDDPKYNLAIEIARQKGSISASYLQRQLKIGYNRAARIVETMQKQGLVSEAEGAKPREWLGSHATY